MAYSIEKRRAWARARYQKFREEVIAKSKARREALRKWWMEFKATFKCIRCNETHPACLDFHHRDPKTKLFSLGKVHTGCINKERILAEVAKCDCLCANCHRKEHWKNKWLIIT